MTTTAERKAINNTRLLFGKSSTETKEFFESIGISAVLAYMKKEPIEIPYVGTIDITYEGDEVTSKGRTANLKATFTPSDFLVRNIGQVEDETRTDAEEILLNRLKQIFKSKIN
jgi:hypothetical protein